LTDDLDQARYKTQEAAKDNTELKLKIDVLTSTTQGLLSEKKHLVLELTETKELSKVFEDKTKKLMAELNHTATEL
jgi:chromosome segregation ATPase